MEIKISKCYWTGCPYNGCRDFFHKSIVIISDGSDRLEVELGCTEDVCKCNGELDKEKYIELFKEKYNK